MLGVMRLPARLWLTAAVAAITIVACLALAPAPAQANGCITNTTGVSDGTAAHPFLIANVENLECMRDNAAYLAAGLYFKQTADIELSAEPVWSRPIGGYFSSVGGTIEFAGNYEGNGKKITGLQVALTNQAFAGLFGSVDGATISNLELANETISITQSSSFNFVGGLIGLAINGTVITNVHTSGTVTGQLAGGIVGEADNGTQISSSSSSVAIIGNDYCAGGLVGCGDHLSITDSSASGSVIGDVYVGGLIGLVQNSSSISRSYATGAVTGRPAHDGYSGPSGYVGGLAGQMSSALNSPTVISDSFATGDVTATDPVAPSNPALCGSCAGGLVGVTTVDTSGTPVATNTITNSYASGTVTSGIAAGGLVGKNMSAAAGGEPVIRSSYSRSAVRGPDSSVGGVLGAIVAGTPAITASFWNPTDADNTHVNSFGTQSTQAAMKTVAPYLAASWDIADISPTTKIWASCSARNDGYPFLQWYGTLRGWTCSAPTPPEPTPPGPTPPGPAPPGPTPPGPKPPGPMPSNAFLLTPSGSSSSSLRSVITTSGAGAASQRGSFSSSPGSPNAKRLTACKGSKKITKAGRYTLSCKLTSAVRSARRKNSIRVTLRTTFTPTGGTARTITRVVTLKKTSSGVTG